MIPILYDAFETEFTHNGICRLSDCTSCKITEERNGGYEMVFDYPLTGVRFEEIQEGRFVYASHDEQGDMQPFEIYRRSAPISGVVTFYARHISYRLSKIILKPFTAGSIGLATQKLKTETFNANPFEFWTDKETTAKFEVKTPASIRSILGGVQGSILDVYGGEYEYDHFTVKIHNHRGEDNGVVVRYGKNLTSLTQTLDVSSLFNSIVPYWKDTDGNCVYGNPVTADAGIIQQAKWTEEDGVIITEDHNRDMEFAAYTSDMIVMDFSEDFKDEAPTPKQLEDKAAAYLEKYSPWLSTQNIKFDFVALWQTEEYKNIAPLERVRLCDTITVEYPALGVRAKAKVIKVVWDVLAERYDSVEVGDTRPSFGDTITREVRQIMEDYPTTTAMDLAIDRATSLITGGMGGHVVFAYDADGKPSEIYVMDTEDVNTAVNVLRINVNGIGFSNNGVNGTYRTAWTLDGNFVADFITTGKLSGNLIEAGTIASRDGKSFWDLDDSEFIFWDETWQSWVHLDQGYIEFGHGDPADPNSGFAKLLRMVASDGEDVFTINAGQTRAFFFKNYIWLYENHSSLRVIDDDDNCYVRASSNGVYAEADGRLQRIMLYGDADNYLMVDHANRRIWIQTDDLIINGYGGYTGWVNNMWFKDGRLVQVN